MLLMRRPPDLPIILMNTSLIFLVSLRAMGYALEEKGQRYTMIGIL